MKLLNLLLAISLLLTSSCKEKKWVEPEVAVTDQTKDIKTQIPDKIQVLNLGTFHMGNTTDANKTEFDEHDRENQKKVHQIAEKLARFDPTVILVETPPHYDEKLQAEYAEYLRNPDMRFENPSETELLGYEIGRLSGTQRIYGIDHKMRYNYRIGHQIENGVDSKWYDQFYEDPLKYFPQANRNTPSLNEKLKLTNQDRYLDFLISINADMLTHAGTENGFEGADEAAKFYQRNLRMYSNLNRIDLNKEDRVLILMGATHTAFFRDFISRSPKYEMVNTLEYLE